MAPDVVVASETVAEFVNVPPFGEIVGAETVAGGVFVPEPPPPVGGVLVPMCFTVTSSTQPSKLPMVRVAVPLFNQFARSPLAWEATVLPSTFTE